jgi:hypothetical protein
VNDRRLARPVLGTGKLDEVGDAVSRARAVTRTVSAAMAWSAGRVGTAALPPSASSSGDFMDWVYWLVFVATAALVVFVYNRRLPGRSVIPGVLLGLVVGLVWPFTLWIVIGFWWHWRGRPDPRATAATTAQLQQARGFAEQAEREGMHTSAAYWHAEAQRLTAQHDQDRGAPVSPGRTAKIAATCAVATVAALVVFGLAVGPPPEATTDIASDPTHEPASPTTATTRPAAPPTTQPPRPAKPATPVAMVVDVIDGDTVDVALDAGGTERVRVLGINAPEMSGREQCWGREAADFAERTLVDSGCSLNRTGRKTTATPTAVRCAM